LELISKRPEGWFAFSLGVEGREFSGIVED
jgi:hypothetical protein